MTDALIVVTDHNFPDLSVERAELDDVGRVVVLDTEDEETSRRQLSRADAVFVRMHELDAETVATMENCRVIARYGIGVDHIDVEAATRHGIYVANAPTYCIEEVSLHTLALILNLARRIKEYDEHVADGRWKSTAVFDDLTIHRFTEGTVGVVGFGRIGRRVVDDLSALGADVLVADRGTTATDLADVDAEATSFDDLLVRSDYVTVHTPLTDETRGLFDADAFAAMPDGACLVNTSRGPIVDTDALLDAIDAGTLAGAGLDVYPDEPLPEDDPIRTHDRVITTPHVAYYSEESDRERREQAIRNVRAALRGDRPPYAVNDPDERRR